MIGVGAGAVVLMLIVAAGRATVVRAEPYPELRVTTEDGRARVLQLVLAACL